MHDAPDGAAPISPQEVEERIAAAISDIGDIFADDAAAAEGAVVTLSAEVLIVTLCQRGHMSAAAHAAMERALEIGWLVREDRTGREVMVENPGCGRDECDPVLTTLLRAAPKLWAERETAGDGPTILGGEPSHESETGQQLTQLDRFPAEAAGHVRFLEKVRDQVRYTANAKGRQLDKGYEDETLAKMVDGIWWTESKARLATLTELPAETAEQVARVLRRELSVENVGRIDELLAPAVDSLGDALADIRDGCTPTPVSPIQAHMGLADLLRSMLDDQIAKETAHREATHQALTETRRLEPQAMAQSEAEMAANPTLDYAELYRKNLKALYQEAFGRDLPESPVPAWTKTPWQYAASRLLAKLRIPGIGHRKLREYLLRVNQAAIEESTELSAELARLDDEGFAAELLAHIWKQCPDGCRAIGLCDGSIGANPVPGTVECLPGQAIVNADQGNIPKPAVAETANAPPPADRLPADGAWLAPRDIARLFPALTFATVDGRLRRYRAVNHNCWREVTEPKPREAKYLYHFGSVKHLFKQPSAPGEAPGE